VKYVGPDLSNPAAYNTAVEEYNRRKQDAGRRGYVDDGNFHPDTLLRMQQNGTAPANGARNLMEEFIRRLLPGGSGSMETPVQASEELIAGIDERGNPIFPLTQEEFREFVGDRMDARRHQELLKGSPGLNLIDIMRQRGLPIGGV
jgi:hypothetical protein